MDELKPIVVAEFACDHGIKIELAFQWQKSYTLRKLDHRIAAVKYMLPKIMHDYDIEIPHAIYNALKRENDKTQLT